MVTLTTGFLMVAAGGLAACDDDSNDTKRENRQFYCTDEAGTVVDEKYCDQNTGHSGSYYLFHTPAGGSTYRPGDRVPLDQGSRFPYNDQATRSAYGLSPTGRVANGTVKTGIVGKGGAPAGGSKGGSSGG